MLLILSVAQPNGVQDFSGSRLGVNAGLARENCPNLAFFALACWRRCTATRFALTRPGAIPYDSARDRPSSAASWPRGRDRILDFSLLARKHLMARKHRIAAIAVLVAAMGLAAMGLGGVYVALGREQPFYTAALQRDPQSLAVGSRELESRATTLYSETRQPGTWRGAFSEEQINGWLAVQLANTYADALPDEISEPRVSIDEGQLTLGFRTRRGGVETVVTAQAAVMLAENGQVAIRLISVHAGALPLPAMQVAEDISQACRELALPVTWTQVEGQPVAIIDVDRGGARGKSILLKALEMRQGTIYVEGQTLAAEEVAGQ